MDGPWMVHGRHVHEGIGWGGWVLWILLTIAFWALVITAIVWLVRTWTTRTPTHYRTAPAIQQAPGQMAPPAPTAAEHILAERFARGEIDEHEYRTRVAVLRGAPPYPSAPQPGTTGGPESSSAPPTGPTGGPPPPA